MSTRELAYNVIDCMSEEQLEGFVMMFKGLIDENTISAETMSVIDDIENNRNMSKEFSSVEALMEDLNADD